MADGQAEHSPEDPSDREQVQVDVEDELHQEEKHGGNPQGRARGDQGHWTPFHVELSFENLIISPRDCGQQEQLEGEEMSLIFRPERNRQGERGRGLPRSLAH